MDREVHMTASQTSSGRSTGRRATGTADLAARAAVIEALHRVAPDVDLARVDWTATLHDVAELDSFDFMKIVSVIADETGVVVPPRDFPLIVTLDEFAKYVAKRQR
jgi:acyl carrier protein